MIYAPVVIPTLNRSEHLKRLICSLKNNTGVENTTIIISVDYPPSEKYEEGYKNVKELLSELDLSMFKCSKIIYQEKNLGPNANAEYLLYTVRDMGFDRYIYSEDDNEFSPNFLQYMNKGLELFEEDKHIVKICGARDTDYVSDGNVLYHKIMPAYGVGGWIDKNEENMRVGEKELYKKHSFREMLKFSIENPLMFKYYVKYILLNKKSKVFKDKDNKLQWVDSIWTIYMYLTDKLCIIPMEAKARTWGNDGTGYNMPLQRDFQEKMLPLDTKLDFEYMLPSSYNVLKENKKRGRRYFKQNNKNTSIIYGWIYYVVYLLKREIIYK